MRYVMFVMIMVAGMVCTSIAYQTHRSNVEERQCKFVIVGSRADAELLDPGKLVLETPLTRTYRHARFTYTVDGDQTLIARGMSADGR